MVSISKTALLAFVACSEALSLTNALQPVYDQAITLFGGDKTVKQSSPEIVLKFPGNDDKPVPGDSPIVQCDNTSPQLLDLKSVVIIPNPPVKGENLTFTAEGVLSADVEDGAYVEVDVRYGFIRLIHQTFDLCEEITKVDLECPIKKGKQVIKKSVEIPDEVPPGKYIVNARAYTKDDIFITCLTATVEFPPS